MFIVTDLKDTMGKPLYFYDIGVVLKLFLRN